jgi:accessory gene regulator B
LVVIAISNYSYLLTDFRGLQFFLTMLLVLLFSPSKIKHHSVLNNKYHFIFKIISIIIVLVGYIFNNDVVQTSLFFQGLTLIHLKGGELDE